MADKISLIHKKNLLEFYHRKKTVLSRMDNILTFVCQLWDNRLMNEVHYQKIRYMIHKEAKEETEKAVYAALEWIETNKKEQIDRFWRCVFDKEIMKKYPTLRDLQDQLFKGLNAQRRLKREQSKERPVEERRENDNDEEQPGPSSQVTQPSRENTLTSHPSPPAKKKKTERMPVTCGDKEGYLYPDKLLRVEKCILVGEQWYTPPEFERLGGKGQSKHWKTSIRNRNNKTLKFLIQTGRLKFTGRYKGANVPS